MVRFRVRPKRTPTDTRAFLLMMAAQGHGAPPELPKYVYWPDIEKVDE